MTKKDIKKKLNDKKVTYGYQRKTKTFYIDSEYKPGKDVPQDLIEDAERSGINIKFNN